MCSQTQSKVRHSCGRDVARHREGALAKRSRNGLRAIRVAYVDGDGCSALMETRRRGAPEPACGAGDDRDSTGEIGERSVLSDVYVPLL